MHTVISRLEQRMLFIADMWVGLDKMKVPIDFGEGNLGSPDVKC